MIIALSVVFPLIRANIDIESVQFFCHIFYYSAYADDTMLIKFLIWFSYNKKIEQDKNFLNHIVKIQKILKLWKLRNLTIEGRIVVFKSQAISKLMHPGLVTERATSTTC